MTISKGYSSLLFTSVRKEREFICVQLTNARLSDDQDEISYWSEEFMAVEGLLDEIWNQLYEQGGYYDIPPKYMTVDIGG